jgi:hypothetical protein
MEWPRYFVDDETTQFNLNFIYSIFIGTIRISDYTLSSSKTELHKPCTSHSVRRCVQLSLHACIWCNGTARHVRQTDDLPTS